MIPDLMPASARRIPIPAYLAPYTPHPEGGDMYGGVFPMVPNDFTGAPAYTMPMAYATPGLDPTMQFMSRPYSLSASSIEQLNVQMMQSIYQNQTTPSKAPDSGDNVHVHGRPKLQCWEHGCSGRHFSTFSNLRRHQREKSIAAAKSTCPNCGTKFTRITSLNGHMAKKKCK